MTSIIKVQNIQYTDGDSALTIADGGGVTAASTLTSTGALVAEGGVTFNEGSNDVDFRVESNGNANMLFVDGGNDSVGIGISNPASYNTHADELVVGGSDGNRGITIVGGDDDYSILNFNRASNTSTTPNGAIEYNHNDNQMYLKAGSSGTAHMYFMGNGEVQIPNGNLKFNTSGKGIDFSASADGAGSSINETLTDYEHGTWTPVPEGGQTISSVTSAFYQKIGQMVYVGSYFNLSAIPNDGAQFYFGGLPFAVASGSHYHSAGSITYVHTTDTQSIGMLPATPYSGGGDEFYFHRNDGTSATVKNSDVQGLAILILGFWYYTTA